MVTGAMKAVILGAGQGKRLLPLTATSPKCLIPVHGRSILEWQLGELARCGIERAVVVTGFAAAEVDALLAARPPAPLVETLYNPFFAVADNIASCWMVRTEMTEDFLLLNGDTLFEAPVLQRLLAAPTRPVTLAIDRKAAYDADDMKVSFAGSRLLRVGKQLPLEDADGESIGMMVFRADGPALFRAALERALQRPEALKRWYLSVIDELAQEGHVSVVSIQGLQWVEIDRAEDLDRARVLTARWRHCPASLAAASPRVAIVATQAAPRRRRVVREPSRRSVTATTSRRSPSVSTSAAAPGNGSRTALIRTRRRRDASASA
jgi:choline kinase